MTHMKKWILALSVCCLAPQGVALAEGNHQKAEKKQQARAGAEQPGSQQKLTGKIEETRRARVGKQRGAVNRVVLLETQDGQKIAVDLGSDAKLKDLELKRGTPVTVSGTVVSIEGSPVFLATDARIGERSLKVQRGKPDQSRRPQIQSFTGTIGQLRDMDVKGADATHKVAVLETGKQDRKLLVDLGPKEELEQLDLEKDDKIQVKGIGMNISGRRVLVAQNLTVDGRSVEIDRQALPNFQKAREKARNTQ